MESKPNIRKATYEVLEHIPAGVEFSSHQLRDAVINKVYKTTGERKSPFHDTVLRYLREKKNELGLVCTSRAKSTYKRIA
jgi:hypothetical protein